MFKYFNFKSNQIHPGVIVLFALFLLLMFIGLFVGSFYFARNQF